MRAEGIGVGISAGNGVTGCVGIGQDVGVDVGVGVGVGVGPMGVGGTEVGEALGSEVVVTPALGVALAPMVGATVGTVATRVGLG